MSVSKGSELTTRGATMKVKKNQQKHREVAHRVLLMLPATATGHQRMTMAKFRPQIKRLRLQTMLPESHLEEMISIITEELQLTSAII